MAPRRPLTRADLSIITFDRPTFFGEVFDYRAGECCTILAPYGGGKSQIGFEALHHAATTACQATVFVMKPKDDTVSRFARTSGFETVRDWPPPTTTKFKRVWGKKPPGYILWPIETGNPEADDYRHEIIFRRAIRSMYVSAKKHPNIMFVDETYSLENELHLTRDLVRSWTKGRSVGNGLWAASQRPAYISAWAYQAQHLFLGHDSDKRAQDRYAEIGAGFDPEIIKSLISSLKRFEFLYISREQRAMCIIAAD